MTTYLYRGKTWEVPEGTTFLELAKEVQGEYDAPILLARVGQKLTELNKKVRQGGELHFLTIRDRDGRRTYERGACMMFLRAMRHVYGRRLGTVKLEYSIADSIYFTVERPEDLTVEGIAEVKETMQRYAKEDEIFCKTKMQTDEVRELFRRHKMTDKDQLFRFRRTSTTNVYSLGNYRDYYYGYMPPSAGYCSVFDLKKFSDGVLLVLPGTDSYEVPGSSEVPEKLFLTMERSNRWGKDIGVPTVGALNTAITRGEGRKIILASEAYQEHLIGEIAGRIREENRRIVMIAGPSSSGKTSFSHRLSIQLANVGLHAHPIAADNYFVDREKTPKDENGEYDFECLEALNLEQFNEQMVSLLRGEAVELPVFNFKSGRQEFHGSRTTLGKDEVLVIEGIHCLNDRFSYAIPEEDKYKVYISALTALNIDEHNRIPTTDNREIRRMVRDARTRGITARETIARWQSVRRGEERHIFPHQEKANVMFNSATLYELAVLKTFAEPLLFAIPQDAPEYPEAKRLLKFLEYFLGLSCEDVPNNSLIREFIGGSIFPVG
ncbi:MAG: nucleoside kinase [Lachnospiraceae bacterium]|nr:nucleoside kinase [Lachnospiraceae bacterium]